MRITAQPELHWRSHFSCTAKFDIVVHKVGDQQPFDYYHQSSMRIFLSAPRQELEIVLVNTSGGLVGEDEMQISLTIESGAASVITSQAAEKAYGSKIADTLWSIRYSVNDPGKANRSLLRATGRPVPSPYGLEYSLVSSCGTVRANR